MLNARNCFLTAANVHKIKAVAKGLKSGCTYKVLLNIVVALF